MARRSRSRTPVRRTDRRALARFTALWLLAGVAVAVTLILAIDRGVL